MITSVGIRRLDYNSRSGVVVLLSDFPPTKRSRTSEIRKDAREARRPYAVDIVGRVEGLEWNAARRLRAQGVERGSLEVRFDLGDPLRLGHRLKDV